MPGPAVKCPCVRFAQCILAMTFCRWAIKGAQDLQEVTAWDRLGGIHQNHFPTFLKDEIKCKYYRS